MEGLSQKLLDYASSVTPHMETATMIAIIVTIALALFYCFFGYKLLRLHISFALFIIGAFIGLVIGVSLNLDNTFILALVVVLALLLSILGFFFYKLGLFLLMFVLLFFGSYGFVKDVFSANYVIFICLAASVLLALLACFVVRPFVIILTALAGGIIASNSLIDNFLTQVAMLNTPKMTQYIVLGFALILAVFGIIFQFRTTENYEEKRTRRRH